MMTFLNRWQQDSKTLTAARQAEVKLAPWALVLITIALFLIAQTIGGFALLPFMIPAMLRGEIGTDPGSISGFMGSTGMVIMLYTTIVATIAFVYFMRKVEKRSYISMGFSRPRAVVRYLVGLGVGVGMMVAAAALACAFGGMRFDGFNEQMAWGTLALFFFGFLFQGMSEEVICRGFLMVSIANRAPLWIGVAINSVLFGALHLFNPGITVLSVVNLLLYGLFASFYFLRTDNIWGIGAMHSAWNFMQGNVLGVEVSGNRIADPVMHINAVADSAPSLSGGAFGLEGSLATTLVLAAGIALLILWPKKGSATPATATTEQ